MSRSTDSTLKSALNLLTSEARSRGLNDAAWAAASGFSKETLSRLRRRSSCDLSTLVALADAVGASVSIKTNVAATVSPDGHFPDKLGRDYERKLLALCASGTLDPGVWLAHDPRFFMAGLAVTIASCRDADRPELLRLAEDLHPGATGVSVFNQWLERSPLRPSRFLPILKVEIRHARRPSNSLLRPA